MNSTVIISTAATSARSPGNDAVQFIPYTPKPKPEYMVAVRIRQNRYVNVIPHLTDSDVDIRFNGEMGLVELDNLIRDLIKAKDKMESAIRGEV